jgi:anthranilate phosphoribosyltransferase
VCLAVERGSPFARHGLDGALRSLGLDGALDPARAARDLGRAGLAACDLALASPPLARLVALRPLLGVRTAMQTVAKLLSSFAPPTERRLVGVFHAPYLESTAEALARLAVPRALVVQAPGGLPEARPGKIVRVATADDTRARTLDLRALAPVADDAGAAADEAGDAVERPPTDVVDGAAINHAALDGQSGPARRAAAAAALILHAAAGADPVTAAGDALAALADGRARAVAERLGRAR